MTSFELEKEKKRKTKRTQQKRNRRSSAGIVLFPSFTRYPIEPSRWVPLCALPALLILAWGAMPLFVRRLSAERVVHLSFLLLALFLASLNRPAAA